MKTVEDYIQMEYKLKVVSKKDFDGLDYYVASKAFASIFNNLNAK